MAPSRKKAKKKTTESSQFNPLPVEALRWRCDPKKLPFKTTTDVEPLTGIIGQDQAVEALRFGLETQAPGQNIFVRGLSGTGRLTLVRRLLQEIRPSCPLKNDRCFVHNFRQPDRPRLITLPPGQGHALRRRIDRLRDFIRNDLGPALSSNGIKARRTALEEQTRKKIEELVNPFEQELQAAGMALVSFQAGPVMQTAIFPVVEGKPVAPEEFEQLHAQGKIPAEQYGLFKEKADGFSEKLASVNENVGRIRGALEESLLELTEKTARQIMAEVTRPLVAEFENGILNTFLEELVDDLITRRLGSKEEDDFTYIYRVNVVLEQRSDEPCPIVVENSPTMLNLLGTIDYDFEAGGEPRSNHLGIRAGSLLQADNGYLVLDALDVLNEPGAWKVLVRTLRTGRLDISPPEKRSHWPGPALKPEPIRVNVKVVLLGSVPTYMVLDAQDPDFPNLFKVLADFDTDIVRNDEGIHNYAAILARIAREEQLLPFDRTAVAALAEHGARIAARDGRLTTLFGRIADIAREAAYIADREDRQRVTGDDVREAVLQGKLRANLPSRRFRAFVADGTIRVETRGSVVGQINGLAVMQSGPLNYGFPARITATIGPGTAGVINIEREAALSGAIHTKGFYILGGLLRHLLRTDHPLAFDASVAFEQSYGGIDGDSASGAEICCLLSALTGIPLRQDLAMTGAIDQMGHILAIGAVNEKIEGYFDTCNDLGLTGTQGVVIPGANAGDLMLRDDVVEACAADRFHIYAVETVLEALEIFTDRPVGKRGKSNLYPRSSVLGIAVERARNFWLMATRSPPSARKGKSK